MLVHQLKQDTIWARVTGKINPGLFESHSIPFFEVLFSLLMIPLPIIMKKKKWKIFPQKSDTFNHVINILISLLGVNMALDSIYYIFTGKNFDKFLKDKFKKENKDN